MQGFERGRVITKEEASLVAHSFFLALCDCDRRNAPTYFEKYTNSLPQIHKLGEAAENGSA